MKKEVADEPDRLPVARGHEEADLAGRRAAGHPPRADAHLHQLQGGDAISTPAATLAFWFGPPPLQVRADWFRKSDAFDEQVRERFGAAVESALRRRAGAPNGPPRRWPRSCCSTSSPATSSAARARPSAGDARALDLARQLVASGTGRALHPFERWFAYLPFEHAEDLAMQDESVRLFTALAAEDSRLDEALDYAVRHRDVVARFGRFPHRNAVLGRTSTDAERDYLAQPGSGF
ncbi:MAG: DUF924 domain-containing protein [Comamonadaceae bacterium]|nr:DUF924 domain-containing protein [Comamonadaceae bacterium]